MKRNLFILLIALVLLPWTVSAQTLTVADGTNSSNYLPFMGNYTNTNEHSQMIYPSNMLTSLQGARIYGFTFYGNVYSGSSYTYTNFTIKIGETSTTNFASATFLATPDATVYSGSLTLANNQLNILFSTPYIYNGGNLLIDFSNIGSDYRDSHFDGATVSGGSILQYSTNSPAKYNFLPKLTIHAFVEGQGATIFVAPNGNDFSSGTTWQTAKASIPVALYTIGSNGTVFAKAGQYNTTLEVTIPAGASLLGGYDPSSTGTDTSQRHLPGTNSHWDDASYCTIINGSRNHRIASIGTGATLDGCVLQNGFTSSDGGGALIDGGTLRHSVIRWCDAINENNGTATGGGVFIRNNGQLLNCVITECRADNGSALAGEDGTATNNTITRNWPANCGTVDDYDGNTYHTVIIGNQCWMKENLRSSHYADGGLIPRKTSGNTSTSPFYFYYYYTDALLVDYGYLYNWSAVMNGASSSNSNPSGVQGVCPNGWHVPSKAEFDEMTSFVNSFARYRCNNGNGSIAKALASQRNWNTNSNTCSVGNNQSTNNTTFFSAMPAGYYYSGTNISDLQNKAYFWTSTLESGSNAWMMYLDKQYGNIQWSNQASYYGYSVRCVKNQ